MTAEPAPASPGPERLDAPRGMHELGAALGRSVWWCEQLFATIGAWVPDVAEAGVRVHLAELSRVLGEHAFALRRHLPRPTGTDPESWVTAPGPGATAALAVLAGEPSSAGRLAGLHRALVPHLLVTWDVHVRRAALADGGVARTIGHAHTDLIALWHDGEELLQGLARAEPAVPGVIGTIVTAIEQHLATVLPIRAASFAGPDQAM